MDVALGGQRRAAELAWIYRPETRRPAEVRALDGKPVHATGPVGPDGEMNVALRDGTRVRATPAEIVAEKRAFGATGQRTPVSLTPNGSAVAVGALADPCLRSGLRLLRGVGRCEGDPGRGH